MEPLNQLAELWKSLWGVLGPIIALLLLFYLKNPERFEKLAVHVAWALSAVSSRIEKRAISREVAYITGSKFREVFPSIEGVPRIEVEWGEEDRVIVDVERGKLVLVLKRGRAARSDNIAKALVMAMPYLIAPQMESVYDKRITALVAAHMARSLVRDNPSIVEAVNQVIRPLVEGDPETLELASMLVDVDDRSLFTRVLVPEMAEVARERYPQRDPRIDSEVVDLIRVLSALARGEVIKEMKGPFCRSYFRIVFVLVARPEKVDKMLEPHVSFVKRSLKECPDTRSIYILAAGRNIAAAESLRYLLEVELKRDRYGRVSIEEHNYRGKYKGLPPMRLYLCRLKLG